MKLIHVLLCMLFGMIIGTSIVCSDEAGDDYQDELQDADDESPAEDVEEIAETTPFAPAVVTPSAPAQPATPVVQTMQTTTAPNAPTVSPKVPATIMIKDTDETDTVQNQSSETKTAATSPPNNQTTLGQQTQAATTSQAAAVLATKNNQDTPDTSLPERPETENEPKEPEPAITPTNQESNTLSLALATATPSTIDTRATIDAPQALEQELSDSLAQPSSDTTAPSQATITTPTKKTELSKQTADTTAFEQTPETVATATSEYGIDQTVATEPQEAALTEYTQENFNKPIDIKTTDAETILSSIGILPQPKVSSYASHDGPIATDESLDVTLSGPLTKKSVGQAIAHLAPLIMSRSVEKAVEQFTNLPAEKALAILEQLIKTSRTDFTKKNKGRPFEVKRNDFLQIIFGVASQYRDAAVYYQFFNLINRYTGLEYGIRPLLFVLSISSYPVLIPDLIAWLEKKGVENSVRDTALYALDRTSARSIKALSTYARSSFEPIAGSLLLYTISHKKPLKMISALLDAGTDVNYADVYGYTPLIKAVEMNNIRATKLLVEHGADIDLIVKDEIGSAWQKSTELPKGTIMEYLQKNAPKTHKPAKEIAF